MKRIFSLFFLTLSVYSFNAEAQYRKIISIAGTGGIGGYGGDGMVATAGTLNGPHNVAVNRAGEVFIVDYFNFRVRKIKTNGSIVTFAGNGITGNTGDGTAATNARMNPQGVATDFRGNVFISDNEHNVIRKVNTINIVSTYAGTGISGYDATISTAINSRLFAPFGLACDSRGNLYVADAGNHMVRKIDTFGVITTIAGDGTPGNGGDGFAAVTSRLDSPYAVAVDRHDNVYIADHNNNRVRVVTPGGIINAFAGSGTMGLAGDGGKSDTAKFRYPTGVAVDSAGNVYISDSYNNVIRMVDTGGYISTVVGNSFPGFGGDLGNPLGANLFHPYGVAVDTFGSIYIADANNQRVRKVYTTTLGIEDVDQTTALRIYPNPANNNITIAGVMKNDKVCVYDQAGRPVTEKWTVTIDGEQTFEIGELATGIYLLQVCDATGAMKATVKLLK